MLEQFLLGDTPQLTEPVKLNKIVKSIAIGKIIKDNTKSLKNLLASASTDAKSKNLVVVNFPIVLPLVKGLQFQEGSIDDTQIVELFEKQHELYDDFFHLKVKANVLNASFFDLDQDCPLPDTVPPMNLNRDLPLKVNFRHNKAYSLLKQEVDKLNKADIIAIAPPPVTPVEAPSVPKEVAVPDHRTVVTSASSAQDP